jgi:hypothetical protein
VAERPVLSGVSRAQHEHHAPRGALTRTASDEAHEQVSADKARLRKKEDFAAWLLPAGEAGAAPPPPVHPPLPTEAKAVSGGKAKAERKAGGAGGGAGAKKAAAGGDDEDDMFAMDEDAEGACAPYSGSMARAHALQCYEAHSRPSLRCAGEWNWVGEPLMGSLPNTICPTRLQC